MSGESLAGELIRVGSSWIESEPFMFLPTPLPPTWELFLKKGYPKTIPKYPRDPFLGRSGVKGVPEPEGKDEKPESTLTHLGQVGEELQLSTLKWWWKAEVFLPPASTSNQGFAFAPMHCPVYLLCRIAASWVCYNASWLSLGFLPHCAFIFA